MKFRGFSHLMATQQRMLVTTTLFICLNMFMSVAVAGAQDSDQEERSVNLVVVHYTDQYGSNQTAYLGPTAVWTVQVAEGGNLDFEVVALPSSGPPYEYTLLDRGNGMAYINYVSNFSSHWWYDKIGPQDTEVWLWVNDDEATMVTVHVDWVPMPPEVEVDRESIAFGSSSTEEDFSVRNAGGGQLNYAFSTSTPWIVEIWPEFGSSTGSWQNHEVRIDRSGLPYGTHNGSFWVTSNGGDIEIDVSVVVAVPDLVISHFAPNFNVGVNIGETVVFEVEVHNQGQAAAGSFNVTLRQSSYQPSGSGPTGITVHNLNYSGLAAGATSQRRSVLITFDNPLQNYYHFFVDTDNSVDESNENNNASYHTISPGFSRVTVGYPDDYDIVVTGCSVDVSNPEPGSYFNFDFNVHNASMSGSTPIGLPSPVTCELRWSPDSNLDSGYEVLGSPLTMPALAAGQTWSGEWNGVTIPTTAEPGATYWVGVVVDVANIVDEMDEENNSCSDTVTITTTPQLVISGCSTNPGTMVDGGYVEMTYEIHNPSTGAVTVRLGCSIAPVGGGNWIDDDQNDKLVDLVAGATVLESRRFTIPAGASPGLYSVWYALRDPDMTLFYDEYQSDDLTVTESGARVLTVPYYTQGECEYCWATSAAMMLSYYDSYDVLPLEFAMHTNTPCDVRLDAFTVHNVLENNYDFGESDAWAHDKFTWPFIGNMRSTLIREIDSGKPVWVASSSQGHAVLFVGYEGTEDNDTVYINDPNLSGSTGPYYSVYTWTTFIDWMNGFMDTAHLIYAETIHPGGNQVGSILLTGGLDDGNLNFVNSAAPAEAKLRLDASLEAGYFYLTHDSYPLSDEYMIAVTIADNVVIKPMVGNAALSSQIMKARVIIERYAGGAGVFVYSLDSEYWNVLGRSAQEERGWFAEVGYNLADLGCNIADKYLLTLQLLDSAETILDECAYGFEVSHDADWITAVPHLVGLEESAIGMAVAGAGLEMGEISYAYDEIVPAGTVISQEPASGTIVVIQTAVDAVVSLGPQGNDLPNLRPTTLPGWTQPILVSHASDTFQDEVIYVGETGLIHWAFENSGPIAAGEHMNQFFVNGVHWRDFASLGLSANTQSAFINQTYMFAEPGTYTLRVEMDTDDEVFETDEDDNVYERTYDVVTGGQASAVYLDYVDGSAIDGSMIVAEAVVSRSAPSTYYCSLVWTGAAGPNGGYTGLQSHPDGDLFIFSVWDPNEIDETKLEWKDTNTVATRYDNEGSGWATKSRYDWQVDREYRFYVVAYDRDGRTYLSQYVHDVTEDHWKHLAVLSYPYQGHWFRAVASFLEDFAPINGEDPRHFDLVGGWKREAAGGAWIPWYDATCNYSIALPPNENYQYDTDEIPGGLRMKSGGRTVLDTPAGTTLARSIEPLPPLPRADLVSLQIVGISEIGESEIAEYTCVATWSDASTSDVTKFTTWLASGVASFDGSELDPNGCSIGETIIITAQADIISTTIYATLQVTVTPPIIEYVISGTILDILDNPLPGVVLSGLPGDPETGEDGTYSAAVSAGWTGIATPALANYTFDPESMVYSNVQENFTDQDYVGTLDEFTISGTILDAQDNPLPGVALSGLPGDPETGEDGTYSAAVSAGWTGTATPALANYTFDPESMAYTNVQENFTDQDYTGTIEGQLLVSNVQVGEGPFSSLVEVSYDLETIGNMPVAVSLLLSTDGGETFTHLCQHVSGDVGEGVLPGASLQITWDAGADFSGLISETCRLRVLAEDGVPPPGFVYISPGTFTMGSPTDEQGRLPNEIQHQVTLTQGFYMSKYEVTEERWYQVMGGTPTTSQLPKGSVSWDLAVQFCNALSVQEGLAPAYTIHGPDGDVTWHQSANGYRLPTEAEWEYACRATTTMAYHNDTNCLSSDTEANFRGDATGQSVMGCPAGEYRGARTEVGSFPANQWGLHDMHGNLWEWVWCGWRTYTSDAQQDPVTSPGPGAFRVRRGGYWDHYAQYCRSAFRHSINPNLEYYYYGFRLVRSAF